MQKIINGKMYNTDTAEMLAEHCYGSNYRDFTYFEEALYRKKNGEFFLAGSGGPLTKYRVSCGQNETSGGSDIVLMTEGEAKQWMEDYASAKEYIAIFGEPEE